MATLQADSTRDKCIEATAQIICALIESGKLPTAEVDTVGSKFTELYRQIRGAVYGRV